MATKYLAFTSLSEALQKAKDMIKGDIHISEEGNVGEIPEVDWTCVDAYNTQWLLKAKPLGLQIWYLLLGLHKANRYTTEELSVKPSLTLCGQIMDSKKQIDCTEHLAFVEGITQMTDNIFNSPEQETEVPPAT